MPRRVRIGMTFGETQISAVVGSRSGMPPPARIQFRSSMIHTAEKAISHPVRAHATPTIKALRMCETLATVRIAQNSRMKAVDSPTVSRLPVRSRLAIATTRDATMPIARQRSNGSGIRRSRHKARTKIGATYTIWAVIRSSASTCGTPVPRNPIPRKAHKATPSWTIARRSRLPSGRGSPFLFRPRGNKQHAEIEG